MASKEQKETWRKLILLAPLFVFYTFGGSLSAIVGRVLFVENVGADYLPYMYMIGAVLGSLMTILIAGMMKQMSLAKLLQLFSWLGAGLFFGSYLLMESQALWVYASFLIISIF